MGSLVAPLNFGHIFPNCLLRAVAKPLFVHVLRRFDCQGKVAIDAQAPGLAVQRAWSVSLQVLR